MSVCFHPDRRSILINSILHTYETGFTETVPNRTLELRDNRF